MMIDINIVYGKIINQLQTSNYLDVKSELEAITAAAATGSEGLISTGSYLNNLKQNNPNAYQSIKNYISDYLKYCRQNGIIIDS